MKKVILFGKPGAGKGTRLSAFLEGREEDFEALSVGNLLRKAAEEQTTLGKKAKIFMDEGKLVPDDIINEIVIDGISNASKNLLMDGFPRTIAQAKAMLESGLYPDMLIEFYADDEVVLQRSKDRIVCGECGEPYTTNEFKRPKNEGFCDKCGGKLVKRKDDAEEKVVKERLEVYKNETYPVLEFLRNNNVPIHTIDNNQKEALEEFKKLMLNLMMMDLI